MSQEAAHHSLQCNTVFFSQVNLIWFSNHFYLLPPFFVDSVVAFDTNNLRISLIIKKCVSLAHEPNLNVQEVEFCFKSNSPDQNAMAHHVMIALYIYNYG